jgi:hypothetical protein
VVKDRHRISRPFSPASDPPPLRPGLVWGCWEDERGWHIGAAVRSGAPPLFILPLSKEHQNAAAAKEICEALGRIYS